MANQTVTGVPGVKIPATTTNTPQAGTIPFRTATLRKIGRAAQNNGTLSTAVQLFNNVLEGTGFLESVDVEVVATEVGVNAAAVAYQPDAPWNAVTSFVFKDINGDLINMPGYSMHLLNMYGGNGNRNYTPSTDANVYSAVAGAVATGGSFRARYTLPMAINRRSLIGALGNQDRSVKYEVRNDINTLANIYSVLPTAPPTFVVNKTMNFCTVPDAQDDLGQSQESLPPWYGTLHMINQLTAGEACNSASTVNHFLRGIGNTIRLLIFIWRDSTGARSDLMLPTNLTLRVGDETVFSESGANLRQRMFDYYGFDAPAGVIVYPFITDFGHEAGFEMGDDWLNTRNVPYAQVEAVYPTFVSTPGTLQVVTDSLIIPEGIDLLANM